MAWIESHQTLRDHPKLSLLCDKLGVNKAQGIGHLHMLWWWCMSYAEDGNLERFSASQIASACDWNGDANLLIEALTASNFIETAPKQVHDWLHFCGDLIKKRLEYKKAKHRRTKRLGISLRISEKSQRISGNSQPTIPNHTVTIPTVTNQPNQLTPKAEFEFEKIWSLYPKRLGRKEAEKHFKASVRSPEDYRNIEIALNNYKRYIEEKKIDEQFIKMGSTWFNNWRDWIDYTGGKNGTNGGAGVSEYAAIAEQARKNRRIAGMGTLTPTRKILAGIRNLPEIQAPSETSSGSGHGDDVGTLEVLREDSPVEESPFGKFTLDIQRQDEDRSGRSSRLGRLRNGELQGAGNDSGTTGGLIQ